jgi:hypothetical protein
MSTAISHQLYQKQISESSHLNRFCQEMGAEYEVLLYCTEVCCFQEDKS